MSTLVTGLFSDSKAAGEAVAELKNKGYTDNISVVAKDEDTAEASSHSIKDSPMEGGATGVAVGGVIGAVAGILAGATTTAIPGIGLVAAGPIGTAVGGAVAGAVGGGIIGALVDKGIPDTTAKEFQDKIQQGQVLVAVDADDNAITTTEEVLKSHGGVVTTASH